MLVLSSANALGMGKEKYKAPKTEPDKSSSGIALNYIRSRIRELRGKRAEKPSRRPSFNGWGSPSKYVLRLRMRPDKNRPQKVGEKKSKKKLRTSVRCPAIKALVP